MFFEEDNEDNGFDGQVFDSREASVKEARIFLVDCSPSMFFEFQHNHIPSGIVKGENAFQTSIRLIIHGIKETIIGSSKTPIAVVFYATDQTNNTNAFQNIHIYQNLDEPSSTLLIALQEFYSDTSNSFAPKIGSVDGFIRFHEALRTCQTLFNEANLINKTNNQIVLFTNRDDPHNGDKGMLDQSRIKLGDMVEFSISICVIPFPSYTGTPFDANFFFRDYTVIDHDAIENPSDYFITRKYRQKRALASCPFEISSDIKIGVKIYCMVNKVAKQTPVFITSTDFKQLQAQTQWLCSSSGQILEDHQIRTYHLLADKKVFFNKDEMEQIKSFGDPGLVLMGFKPYSVLKDFHNFRTSYFLFPDESNVLGSIAVFKALVMKLHEKKKIAIARLISKAHSTPSFVALCPQLEEKTEDDIQEPMGLHAIFLPYCDDIRNLTLPHLPTADDNLVDVAKRTISRIEQNFSSIAFPNPHIEKHYAFISSISLNSAVEQTDDYTVPDTEYIDEQTKELIDASGIDRNIEVPSKKRKKPANDDDPETKKVKRVASSVDIDTDEMRKLAESNDFKKVNVPSLKAFLKNNALPVSGAKAVLIERIKTFFQVL